jgi:hypothetical protein
VRNSQEFLTRQFGEERFTYFMLSAAKHPGITDGSHSVRDLFVAIREAGATARTMLEQAA